MNKLMLSCLVAGLALKAQASSQYTYWVEGDLTIALTLSYTDYENMVETETGFTLKTKTEKITNATVIKDIAEQEGVTDSISKSATLMVLDNGDDSSTFIIRDPKGLGDDLDVSAYFDVSYGEYSSEAETIKYDADGYEKSGSGSGQLLTSMSVSLAAGVINLTGLDKYTWKDTIPKDDVNFEIYSCDSDSITCFGGDEATGGVVAGTVTVKEKLVKAIVVD